MLKDQFKLKENDFKKCSENLNELKIENEDLQNKFDIELNLLVKYSI